MRNIRAALILVFLLSAQPVFADVTPSDNMNPPPGSSGAEGMPIQQCENIAKACESAGFTRKGAPGKGFWHDCMKPLLQGQVVKDVSINADEVVKCKQMKIEKMKKELQELEQPVQNQSK